MTPAKCSHLNLTIPRLSLFLVALIFWSPGKHSLAALDLVTQRLQNKDNLHVMKGLNGPRSHFISRLSMIVSVNVVLNRTLVVDSD